jgi:hypothetical protein
MRQHWIHRLLNATAKIGGKTSPCHESADDLGHIIVGTLGVDTHGIRAA